MTMTAFRPNGGSVAQLVARRQVRMHLRKIREREYSKLRSLIPAVASKKKASKVQVVEEAVRYIEELHLALMERFRERHGNLAEDKAQETVQTFVQRMMEQQRAAPAQVPPVASAGNAPRIHVATPLAVRHAPNTYERDQRQPSFMLKKVRSS